MTQAAHGETFAANPAENYERYFVPVIGRPCASDLVDAAALRPGERVLDVACGTGIAARLAAERVSPEGRVAGLDLNPGMIAVARAVAPPDLPMEWYEAPAEDLPFEDEEFDAVLCGIGLQFFSDRAAGLREMCRVLAPDGRVALNLPGPIPPLFEALGAGLTRHIGPEAAGFVAAVFSLHDADEIRELVLGAGFGEVEIAASPKPLRAPPPREFLWQYIAATPLSALLAGVDPERRGAFEEDVCSRWQEYVDDGSLALETRMTTVVARKRDGG